MKLFISLLLSVLTLGAAQDVRNSNYLATGELTHGDDAPPLVANAMDDEFNQATFNSGLWTWVNQSTASVSVSGKGYLEMTVPGGGTGGFREIVQNLPSAPYSFKTKFVCGGVSENFHFCGMVLRESATGKAVAVFLQNSGPTCASFEYSITNDTANPATFNVPVSGSGSSNSNCGPFYVQMARTGTTITISWSTDPAIDSMVRTASFTMTTYFTTAPNQIGIFTSGQTATNTGYGIFYFFRRIS